MIFFCVGVSDGVDDDDMQQLEHLQLDVNHLPPLFGLEAPAPELCLQAADGTAFHRIYFHASLHTLHNVTFYGENWRCRG